MKALKICVLLVLSSLLFVAGCATQKAQLPPETATSLVNLRHSLGSGKLYLESTSETLRDLIKNPRLNTERQIQLYVKEMGELETAAQEVRDINLAMQAHTKEYYTSWNNEVSKIHNPEISAAGQKRMEETQKVMQEVVAKMNVLKEKLGPYMSNLRDIKRYLQKDQTIDGVMAIKPVIEKTLDSENTAIEDLDQIISDIDKITRSVE